MQRKSVEMAFPDRVIVCATARCLRLYLAPIVRRKEGPMSLRFSIAALIAAILVLLEGPAFARCSKNLVEKLGPGAHFASLDGAQFAAGNGDPSPNRAVITFVGHASYQIDT